MFRRLCYHPHIHLVCDTQREGAMHAGFASSFLGFCCVTRGGRDRQRGRECVSCCLPSPTRDPRSTSMSSLSPAEVPGVWPSLVLHSEEDRSSSEPSGLSPVHYTVHRCQGQPRALVQPYLGLPIAPASDGHSPATASWVSGAL